MQPRVRIWALGCRSAVDVVLVGLTRCSHTMSHNYGRTTTGSVKNERFYYSFTFRFAAATSCCWRNVIAHWLSTFYKSQTQKTMLCNSHDCLYGWREKPTPPTRRGRRIGGEQRRRTGRDVVHPESVRRTQLNQHTPERTGMGMGPDQAHENDNRDRTGDPLRDRNTKRCGSRSPRCALQPSFGQRRIHTRAQRAPL